MNVNINIAPDPKTLGHNAAEAIAILLREAIKDHGTARIILSTGASQFETISALVEMDIPWDKVEMFHLDEYVGLSESHKASFRKYLKERFVSKISLKAAHFVNGEGDVSKNIEALTKELRKSPIDVGVIGIGENGHIAFNDPPADFDTEQAYKVVNLDERCKLQQVGEGWFPTLSDVPSQAITMCVKQIMACRHIVTAVPHQVKAKAIFDTLTQSVNPNVPATIMKGHPCWQLFIDDASAGMLFKLY
ncbi:6-phosphogluconolactonase/glucosamine-6-phosphate isomerase/deaminase [Sphaerochaeta pleomorpha str. Grapes]|uniref:6-phosphogluconolactonase/glucosamine-6-phosphate isomerase/deaminase n=1 Tax=Sphaerochaeta pleomorpha (strain ATCC BAA-1885 / DSM 22778 / Grapes) TaxID=158190 RepID=G8QQU9_SPHPG|nr:6-phosphogluconolactonase [Sphaerochaeta pleomorpha]AEV28730.1 6-phosphogluconolactonase/glucosamine-6-phosphate isomerase/deaminase [Sphaerochaeta pleomorpha str. Grapes]